MFKFNTQTTFNTTYFFSTLERRNRLSMLGPPPERPTANNQNGPPPLMASKAALTAHRQNISYSGKSRKDKDRKLTKADIGLPQDFRHLTHIGWDPNKGFDMDNVADPQLKQFFDKAGVKECQLQDPQTREFIYDFITQNGGLQVTLFIFLSSKIIYVFQ
jgi:neural Wiskott-Aldrich syndrome protein